MFAEVDGMDGKVSWVAVTPATVTYRWHFQSFCISYSPPKYCDYCSSTSIAIIGMEDPTAGQDQAVSTPIPTSPPADNDASVIHHQVDTTIVTNSDNDEIQERNGDVNHEVVHEDEKPSVSQGQAIVMDSELQVNEPDGLAEHPTSKQNADPLVQYARPMEEPSSLTVPPTPPAKSPTYHDGRAIRDSSEVAPPTPAEKSDARQTNGHHEASLQTPTAPLSAASHRRSLTISKGHTVSVVLISSALETILSSREAKRSAELRESAQHALEMVRSGQGGDRPREIFEPLRLACETRNEKLMIASLDCISKLISYSFFAEVSSAYSLPSPPLSPASHVPSGSQINTPSPSLVDLVAHTITACHTETTPETVSLQIVKALLSLVLSPVILIHQSSLLKAVRTVYNVFLLSTDPVNQMVAQGGLTQMVHHVFTRCKLDNGGDSSDATSMFRATATEESTASASRRGSLTSSQAENGSLNHEARAASHREAEVVLNPMNESTISLPTHPDEPSTPNGTEQHESPSGEHRRRPTLYVHPRRGTSLLLIRYCRESFEATNPIDAVPEVEHGMTTHDLFIKDAFLVFRALCKLTMKALNNERLRFFFILFLQCLTKLPQRT
jgi:brefeldin A-inhibited guanine nucleotide-exchange protein